jgi:hypothetical protein
MRLIYSTALTVVKKIKIISFVTHTAEIQRILSGIGSPFVVLEFDLPYEFWNICQLVSGIDGFPEIQKQIH